MSYYYLDNPLYIFAYNSMIFILLDFPVCLYSNSNNDDDNGNSNNGDDDGDDVDDDDNNINNNGNSC